MSWGAVAVIGGGLVMNYLSSEEQSNAASSAAGAQTQASLAGIDEQRRQFDAIQKLLNPYVQAGTGALTSQQNLLGLNGADAQGAAIEALRFSPQYTALTNEGENAILQNASATGGLRGGNTQGALAQFRPQVLSSLIQQQLGNLGGLTTLGQNSAVQQGAAGQAMGNNVSGLLGQFGSAQAGNALAQGNANAQMWNGLSNNLGMLAGSQF
jgi:hypothetical protein